MSTRAPSRLGFLLFCLLSSGDPALAADVTYPAGSLVIPMDETYQDRGMLRAFGLVYKILKAGVQVDWVIKDPKDRYHRHVNRDRRHTGGSFC